MNETFIQDAISCPDRLQRVLAELGYQDFLFDADEDVLNQEFNFTVVDGAEGQKAGRIDVVSTFNERTKLVLVEVKSLATSADIAQLAWYLDCIREMCRLGGELPKIAEPNGLIAILLAEQFAAGTYDLGKNMHCVKFGFNERHFPFEPHQPLDDAFDTSNSKFKKSRLWTLDEHVEQMPMELRIAVEEFCRLCLKTDSVQRQWIFVNVKGGHIAVHYKGEYLLYLFPRKRSFDVGMTQSDGASLRSRIGQGGEMFDKVLPVYRESLATCMADIDSRVSGIPNGFDWEAALQAGN